MDLGGAGFLQSYAYDYYSELAGEFREPGAQYRVTYRRLNLGWARVRAWLLVLFALVFETVFLVWLLHPSHYPTYRPDWTYALSIAMIVSIGLIETFRLLNVSTLALATLHARDPIPVPPEPGTRVAFITTIVPGKEPLDMVRATLQAALQVRHDGVFHVWLLDEGDDADVKAMCAELGVRHFSRKGVPEWNQPSGRNKAKTKHGNYNAWFDAHGHNYDFWVSVDTDHVPQANFAERLLGYFRDPDVAFVVGPQVYGNYDNFITRAAESQQYLFHSLLQRAANTFDCAMFVGTNNAVRLSALRAIDGLQDSITEDAATSIVWHSGCNPETGNQWKSVYTPDVLAVGEGPSRWGDYFTQQARWARGTDEVVLRGFGRIMPRLSWRRRLHYALLMSYYPSAALTWVLGTVNLTVYLITGIGSVVVSAQLWLMLYVNAAFLQLGVYFWNRRHNVSPHEELGSSGLSGMAVSVLSAPLYVTALLQSAIGKSGSFAVTPKGAGNSGREPLRTFVNSRHLLWGALLGGALLASFPLGNAHLAMRTWACLALAVCLAPVLMALLSRPRTPEPLAEPIKEIVA
jgi:cellulose synthase/poly-beta-1,6-N-acetylglucosamine synthase-like glycosyltransferase